ncbi:hypothetical protein TRAPUB_12024 [Trametes pubescens]|uniref:F-box domain-containing protein n=1 Tax=Trametes pubescens TaxID=154538 RepID=A0A1M2VVB4_TRAPU|nr:hypothetical protein TRAPUB_12024 [Trametes pubescens]
MQLLDLNVDVLLHISRFQTRTDISRLTRTCRSLHEILAPTILKGLVILTGLNLASFSQFMHLDSTGRRTGRDLFPFLRTLRLYLLPDFSRSISLGESIQAFTDILKHCTHLASLALYHPSIAFTSAQLRLALSAPLPDLQDIALEGITIDCWDALADVASPLRTVNLTMSTYTGEDIAHANPLPLLQFHRSTLTTLTLTRVSLGDVAVPFPSVRRLTIFSFTLADNETGWVGPLVRLFPGVEHVELWSLHARDGSSLARRLDPRDSTALLIAGDWRTRARVWQAQHGTWANGLRFLRMHSVMELYCLGLSCRIERLDLHILSPSETITTGALADHRPRCLRFQILSPSDMDQAVPVLLRTVAQTSSVTHLMIEFGDDLLQYSDLGNLLARIAALLCNIVVSHLVLHISTNRFSQREQLFGAVGSDSPRAGGAPEVLQIFAQDNRALQRVFVSYERGDVRAWEAFRATGESITRWTEMGQFRARELISSEGLVRYAD